MRWRSSFQKLEIAFIPQHFFVYFLTDVSSSPRSMFSPPRAITPQRSEVRQRDLAARSLSNTSSKERGPAAVFVVFGGTVTAHILQQTGAGNGEGSTTACHGDCHGMPLKGQIMCIRGRPAGSLPVPSVAAVTPQRSEVGKRAVLCLFIREGFASPTMQLTPCLRLRTGGALQACLAHQAPPVLLSLLVPACLACTGLPIIRLLSRDTLGDYHRGWWCS